MASDREIVFNKFVELIEENHQTIAEFFMNDLLRNPDTAAYRSLDRHSIYESGDMIYRELSKFLARKFSKDDIAKHYLKLSRDRYRQGVPLSHLLKALILLKRHLWLFVENKMEYDLVDYKQALDLNNRVVLYFDRAAYFCAQGYEDALSKKW